ncbi:Protein kinase domain-containing protein, partial [Trichostrongylus colubriformis]
DVSRTVEEPKKRALEEEGAEAVNYDRLDARVDLSKHKPIDINRLPNDLQAKYIICEELGQGAYGTVYRAIEKATGKTWAAKMVQ